MPVGRWGRCLGKKRKNGGKSGFEAEVRALCEDLLEDETIDRFEIAVDKVLGMARLRTVARDGRVASRELVGPGLAVAAATREERDAAILDLAAKGLTQMETARLLGVSQALVSKVLRKGLSTPAA